MPFVQQTGDGWRVVVIEPAEALNTASANALLKTLEEPGERVILILLADHYLKLPATIRSRLQHFALDRLDAQDAQNFIQQQIPNISAEHIDLLLNLANGMPLTAVEINQSDWLHKRDLFLKDWFKLVAEKNMSLSYSSKWSKELSFSEFMTMFEYLLADLVAIKLNQSLRNKDLDLTQFAQLYDLESLFQIYSDLQQKKLMVEQNVQTQLVLDQLFIQLMHVD